MLADARGLAAVDLRAGSAEISFSVQISAPHTAPKVLYIEMGDVGFGVVSARSVYGGDLPERHRRARRLPALQHPHLRRRSSPV